MWSATRFSIMRFARERGLEVDIWDNGLGEYRVRLGRNGSPVACAVQVPGGRWIDGSTPAIDWDIAPSYPTAVRCLRRALGE